MSNILTIGLHCEGTTDERFLLSVIKRTFDAVALECVSQLEVYEPQRVASAGGNFVEAVKQAATEAHRQGLMVLCVHADADAPDDRTAFDFKLTPALFAVAAAPPGAPPRALPVAVVPVRTTEAWMLADAGLLRDEIGSLPAQADLPAHPEKVANPKEVIEEAIRLALADRPRRHRDQLQIGDLYQPLGQKIPLHKLELLPSYRKFKEAVRSVYRELNYLV